MTGARQLISLFFNSFLLISAIFGGHSALAQSPSSSVTYEARDSIVAHIPTQVVTLYGEAYVQFEDIELTADFIQIDLKKGEILATYSLDSLGQPVGKPVFTSGGEESRCDYVRYNYNTKKGYVKEVRAQQGEGYIHMAESKIHPNEEVHLHDGKFTTCDADTPHYHFQLTRAIIVPDERIVTGPVYMKLFKIPLPLAAPFGFFPNSDTKKSGIILPRFATTAQYGFGLQDLGYYLPLGDYWETYFYATVFTSGRFGVQNITNYYRKYKFDGTVGLKFEQFRGKFYDTLVYNKWTFNWKHVQDAKAHPTLKFTSDVNFISDNNPKTTLEAINPNYFNNQFNSAINVTKRWKLGKISGSMGLKTALQQNAQSKNYTVELPTYNLSINRFDLGVLRSQSIGKKWYENINVSYSMNARNYISARDTLFRSQYAYLLNDYVLNGVQQNAILQSNLRLFNGRVMFEPNINYTEVWNFQYEKNTWDDVNNEITINKYDGFKSSRYMSFSGRASSNFFGYYKMLGKKQMKFRHVANTSVGFTFRPDLGLYELVQSDSLGNTTYYSPFDHSLYRENGPGTSGAITFSIGNTLEMKMRDKKDSINESFKNFKLVDAFSLNGNYDIMKDTCKLSDLSFAFRTARFLNIFNFQSNAVLSPYSHDAVTGLYSKEYAWEVNQGLGTFKTGTMAVTANFTNKTGRKKQEELNKATENDAEKNGIATDPNLTSFEIPWKLNLSYNFNYTRKANKEIGGTYADTIILIQTLRADGDFNITEKWKFTYGFAFDLQAKTWDTFMPTYNFTILRDLHCWEAYLTWIQYGPIKDKNVNFLFRVNIKASMFQDIKVELTQPPFFF